MATELNPTKAENRTIQVATYVTPIEAERIANEAERDQRSISDWVRVQLLGRLQRKGAVR